MNLLAILSLISVIVSLALGVSVFVRNPKSQFNQLFFILCVFNAYWAFSEFEFRHASSMDEAVFWMKSRFLWPFALAIPWHLVLLFTMEEKLLNNVFTYLLIYMPALAISILELNTNLITGEPLMMGWGWAYQVPEYTEIYLITTIWMIAIIMIPVGLIVRYYYRTPFKQRKKQSVFITIGLFLPVSFFVFIMLLQTMGVYLPEIHIIIFILGDAVIAFAIVKYELFSMSLSHLSDLIVSNMRDSIALMDKNGRILEVNEGFKELVGIDKDKALGTEVQDMFVEDFERLMIKVKQNVKNSSERLSDDIELHARRIDGRMIPVTLSISPVSQKNGEIEGYIIVFKDISKRKKIEKDLKKERSKADLFLDVLGHDLGNLYQGLSFAIEIGKNLRDREKLDITFNRMEELVNRSIKLTKFVQIVGSEEPSKGSQIMIDVVPLLERAVSEVKYNFEKKEPIFDIDIPKGPIEVRGSPVIKDAIQNILHNAVKVQNQERPKVTIVLEDRKKDVLIRISDCGPGISDMRKKVLTEIMDDDVVKNRTGIGLAMTNSILNKYGGSLDMEDRVNGDHEKGALIIIKLTKERP